MLRLVILMLAAPFWTHFLFALGCIYLGFTTEQRRHEVFDARAEVLQQAQPQVIPVQEFRSAAPSHIPVEVHISAQSGFGDGIKLTKTKSGRTVTDATLILIYSEDAGVADRMVRAAIIVPKDRDAQYRAMATQMVEDAFVRGAPGVLHFEGLRAFPSERSLATKAMDKYSLKTAPHFFYIDPFLDGRAAGLDFAQGDRFVPSMLSYSPAAMFFFIGIAKFFWRRRFGAKPPRVRGTSQEASTTVAAPLQSPASAPLPQNGTPAKARNPLWQRPWFIGVMVVIAITVLSPDSLPILVVLILVGGPLLMQFYAGKTLISLLKRVFAPKEKPPVPEPQTGLIGNPKIDTQSSAIQTVPRLSERVAARVSSTSTRGFVVLALLVGFGGVTYSMESTEREARFQAAMRFLAAPGGGAGVIVSQKAAFASGPQGQVDARLDAKAIEIFAQNVATKPATPQQRPAPPTTAQRPDQALLTQLANLGSLAKAMLSDLPLALVVAGLALLVFGPALWLLRRLSRKSARPRIDPFDRLLQQRLADAARTS
jgi:hypothetical protein